MLATTHAGEDPGRLERCLASIAAQSLAPVEVVLVLDGPLGPDLDAVLAGWRDRLPLRIEPRAKGPKGGHLNHGLGLCAAEIVIRCDSDDVSHPDRFRRQAGLLAASGAAVCSGPIREIAPDPDGGAARITVRRVPGGRVGPASLCSFFRNPVNGNNCALRRSVALAAGGFPAGRMEDYRLWLGLLAAGHAIENHGEILLDAAAGDLAARRTGADYRAAERATWRVNARRLGGLGIVPATLALALRLPLRYPAMLGLLRLLYRRVLR